MFADQLWPNLLLFAAGQAAAWYYLHTGRTRIGAASTVALWVLVDWWLVAHYVYRASGGDLLLPLGLMQATALLTVAALGFALWRRRWSAAAKARPERFTAGMATYLRGDLPAAELEFRRLVRTDPWDAAAWLALANVLARAGRVGPARRCCRRALGVDTTKAHAELVQHQLARLQRTAAPAADAAVPGTDRAPAVEAASSG
ncbi:MAG: hypothetical protein JNL08_09020 [Planctomycetes bacterium]|nr:hypothetical protein [Planctomycetota bacterium]